MLHCRQIVRKLRTILQTTYMVRNIENGLALIEKWLRNKNTIEFLGIWEEMYNPKDRRYLHPFINCTCCGPRLTILDSLPYDRERTSMKEFPMCPSCADEYHSPDTRRYDAQPVCCNGTVDKRKADINKPHVFICKVPACGRCICRECRTRY